MKKGGQCEEAGVREVERKEGSRRKEGGPVWERKGKDVKGSKGCKKKIMSVC